MSGFLLDYTARVLPCRLRWPSVLGAVGLAPGLPILSAPAISRLLFSLLPRLEVTPEPQPPEPRTKSRPERHGDPGQYGVLTAAVEMVCDGNRCPVPTEAIKRGRATSGADAPMVS